MCHEFNTATGCFHKYTNENNMLDYIENGIKHQIISTDFLYIKWSKFQTNFLTLCIELLIVQESSEQLSSKNLKFHFLTTLINYQTILLTILSNTCWVVKVRSSTKESDSYCYFFQGQKPWNEGVLHIYNVLYWEIRKENINN